MGRSVEDARAGKIIFVAHCLLNQNAKVRGIARYPAAVRPIIDLLLDNDIAIYQMPCPEMLYLGAMRWGQVKPQYDSPMFRRHCRRLAEEVLDQLEDYRRCGYRVPGFLLTDGSPVCGLKKTPVPAEDGLPWGGMVWSIPAQRFAGEPGVFSEVLQEEAARRKCKDILYLSFPEVDEAGRMEETLEEIKKKVLNTDI
jgi:predicted secreted protein